MTKMTSINIQPLTNNSEVHNTRRKDLDYVNHELTHKNESWVDSRYQGVSMARVRQNIEERYQSTVGQRMQHKAVPLREGVVVIDGATTMAQLQQLAQRLEQRFGIKTMQIHIHRDEGYMHAKEWKPNLHAHMHFDWTQPSGKSVSLNKRDMAEMQTIVAEALGMKRGVSSDRKHLSAIQYKTAKESERYTILCSENKTLTEQNQELTEQHRQLGLELEKMRTEIKQLNITRRAKDALMERVNGFTNILGKSKVQTTLEERTAELVTANEQIAELQATINRIHLDLERRTQERANAQRQAKSYQTQLANRKTELLQQEEEVSRAHREAHKLEGELIEERKRNLDLRRAAYPQLFALPSVVDMKQSRIIPMSNGHGICLFLNDGSRPQIIPISGNDYAQYITGRLSLEEIIGLYCTHEIDVAIAQRLSQLQGEQLQREIAHIANTMFSGVLQVLHIAFAQSGGSTDYSGRYPNLRHKNREEILRELIDEGYSVKM